MTDAIKTPKMLETLKMLVVPAVFMFSKKVDFTNPQVLQLCQMVFAAGMGVGFLFKISLF